MNMRGEVSVQREVSFSDLADMLERVETTGEVVTFSVPGPQAAEDAALLNWLNSGSAGETVR